MIYQKPFDKSPFIMMHVVLDIDHTLLEAVPEGLSLPRAHPPDKKLTIQGVCLHIWFRPYLRYFLECLRTSPELVSSVSFFSLGAKPYCEAIVDLLIPESKRTDRFPFRVFSREDSDVGLTNGVEFHIKNLQRKFWSENDIGASIANTLIIDDNIYVHALHPHNVIRVKPFHTDFQKHRFAYDTTLKDIYDALVQYRTLNLKYIIPPCKCFYTQIRGRDNMDPENICFTCLTNHVLIRKQNKAMEIIYDKVLKLRRKIRSKEHGF